MFVREQQVPHEEQSDQEAEKFPGLKAGHQRPRGSQNGRYEYWIATAASVCLDVEGPNDVAPLLRFVGDELAEVGGRARKRRAS